MSHRTPCRVRSVCRYLFMNRCSCPNKNHRRSNGRGCNQHEDTLTSLNRPHAKGGDSHSSGSVQSSPRSDRRLGLGQFTALLGSPTPFAQRSRTKTMPSPAPASCLGLFLGFLITKRTGGHRQDARRSLPDGVRLRACGLTLV